jgi:hydroxymethylpyrimidine pyrophosphatase-like HAD family hydrolase
MTLQQPISESFPMPANRVALMDIDGTLIDAKYKVTDPGIYAAIQDAKDAGWTIGLSSDTPYDTMRERAIQFGVTDGPLICEKGGLVSHGDWAVEPTEGLSEAFRTSRQRIAGHLAAQGLVVWHGNPADVLEGKFGEPGDDVVLVNTRRQYGISFYFREVDSQGNLQMNESLTDRAVAEMSPFYPDFDDLDEDKNHECGILIVNRLRVTKRIGTQALMQHLGVQEVAMIGNSYADYLGDDIAVHYAVGDSDGKYKAVADYTASAPLTAGSAEILRRMAAA